MTMNVKTEQLLVLLTCMPFGLLSQNGKHERFLFLLLRVQLNLATCSPCWFSSQHDKKANTNQNGLPWLLNGPRSIQTNLQPTYYLLMHPCFDISTRYELPLNFNQCAQVCLRLARVPRHLLKYVVNYDHLAMHYIVLQAYTVLFHNQGGYYNSLILLALELSPQAQTGKVMQGIGLLKHLYRSFSVLLASCCRKKPGM